MKITLPFPPSVNSMFSGGSKQQRFPSAKYKQWVLDCPKLEPIGLRLCTTTYEFFFPDNRKRDLTNYVKAPEDYLVKQGVIIDDSWHNVHKVILQSRGISKKSPRVMITIYGQK